mmetsp:Transcript_67999/g.107850  ORF Transcript_67999/g.107850 Transcript_67999/m.107850 type:complete len:98 (+) Transcript_67999:218-511(+)
MHPGLKLGQIVKVSIKDANTQQTQASREQATSKHAKQSKTPVGTQRIKELDDTLCMCKQPIELQRNTSSDADDDCVAMERMRENAHCCDAMTQILTT